MRQAVLAFPLLLLAACAEEDEGTGSIQATGVGVVTPWSVLIVLLLVLGAAVVLSRRRR